MDTELSVVLCMSAQPCLSIAPLAESSKIPTVAIALPRKIVENRKYLFLFFATAEDLARSLVDEVIKRKIQNIARISTIHDGRQNLRRLFDSYNGSRINISLDEDFPPEERDFRSFLTKMKTLKGVDGIYANLFLGQLGLFVKQAKEQKIEVPIFTTEFYSDRNEAKIAGKALEGQWYVDQVSPSSDFIEKYTSRFGSAPSLAAGNGYDLVLLLSEALKKGFTSGEELTEYLRTVHDFKGSLGTYSSTGDNRFGIPVVTKEIRGIE